MKKTILFMCFSFVVLYIINSGCNDSSSPVTENKIKIAVDKDQIVFSQSLYTERVIILNQGSGELSWSVQSKPDWLLTSKTEGVISLADTLFLSINTTNLAYNDYQGTLVLTSNSGSKEITISFTFYAPVIKLSSDVIYFSRDYYTASIVLENTGGSILAWNMQNLPSWLNVSKTSDSLRYSVDYITFTVNFFNLVYGDYEQVVDIQSNGGNAQIAIHLYFEQVIEIYPGVSAAEIAIGAPFRDIKQKYGSPPLWSYTETDDHLFRHKVEYPERGLTFYFVPQSSSILIPSFPVESVYMVEPYDGLLETNLGIKSSKNDIINAYGTPDENNQAGNNILYNEGIAFYFNDNSLVQAIQVFAPK